MTTTIKIQNTALKDLVFSALKSNLAHLQYTEKNNSIIVSDTKNFCIVNINKDEVNVIEPIFTYNKQLLVGLFILGALPFNLLCLIYLPFVVSIILAMLPSFIVLAAVYNKTYRTQHNAFLEEYDLFKVISSTIKKSFSKSIS